MTGRQTISLLGFLLTFGLVAGSVFTVDESERVLVTHLGKPAFAESPPGVHFKLPLVDSVQRFDGRMLTLDTRDPQVRTSDGQYLAADFFVKWQIAEVGKYYGATNGDEGKAFMQMSKVVQAKLNKEFATESVQQVVSGMDSARTKVLLADINEQLKGLGVTVLDVRLKSVGVPDELTNAVFEHMQTDRKKAADEVRANGDTAAEQVHADADRQREAILGEALRNSEGIKADGDAQAAAIYNAAYGKNLEFYSFYRSLSIYQNTLHNKGDVLVLEPDGELFKYFNPPTNGR